jgi:hypothetical protein
VSVDRHPIRGLVGGFLLGLGLALILVFLGLPVFGVYTVIILVAAFTVLGLVLAYVLPARGPGSSG